MRNVLNVRSAVIAIIGIVAVFLVYEAVVYEHSIFAIRQEDALKKEQARKAAIEAARQETEEKMRLEAQ